MAERLEPQGPTGSASGANSRRRPGLFGRELALSGLIGLGATLGAAIFAQAQTPAPATAAPAAAAAAPVRTPVAAPAAMSEAEMLASLATPAGRDGFVRQYCAGCHSTGMKAGNLVLQGASSANPWDSADLWEKVARRVAAGEMPPPAARQPDAKAAHAFVASLVEDLDAASGKAQFAGPSVIRRLNRTEYSNAVRDLLAVDFPFTTELPPDGLASGFDNIGDALSMSPVLLESYLKVGRQVSELALGVSDPTPVTDQFPVTQTQSEWIGAGAPFGTRGGVVVRKYFPAAGTYELRAIMNPETFSPTEGSRLFRTRVHVDAGEHTFVVTFPLENAAPEGPIPALPGPGGDGLGGPLDVKGSAWGPSVLFLLDGKPVKQFEIRGITPAEAAFGAPNGPAMLSRAEIEGPYDVAPVVRSASRDRILTCQPRQPAEEAACAEKILTSVARRAYRREVGAEDVKPLVAAYQRARPGRSFDSALAVGLRDVLVSPDFLFRLEFDPQNARPGQVHPVNDYELATRLSFFLWSSIPDDALLDAARRGELRRAAGYERQVRRLLADRRADAVVANFATQWLGLHEVAAAAPDKTAYPEFDDGLRDAFQQETQLFLRSIIRENRSVLDVINADYTYLNERLAAVYGVPGVRGSGFRRVQFAANSPRGGILGHGGILMATSHTNKTSPVLRGKWILDNLLNSPPSPPPAGVPPLNEAPADGGRVLTTREQVERHRSSPVCSSCHARMDPFGFALESFDVLGRWRDKDEGGPIDPTGELPNGEKFTGPAGLRAQLASHSEQFVGATVARLMTYALGRPLEGRDQPTVRAITRSTKDDDYRFNDIVLAIANSPQFKMKQTSQP
jgi:hypothetical protein